MTLKVADRVRETTVTTGTGDYMLEGAPIGFQPFSVFGAGDTCPYVATDGINWEVGVGTVQSGPSRLERTTILASSNAGVVVNWGAGTKDVICTAPAAFYNLPTLPRRDSAGSETLTAAHMGKTIVTSVASTLTLPLLSDVEDGQLIAFSLNAAVSVVVQRQSTDELSWNANSNITSIKLTSYGDYLVLMADALGARWRVLSEHIQGPYFRAQYEGPTVSMTTSTPTKLPFNTEITDSHNAYDPVANYRFTAPIPGWYSVFIAAYISGAGNPNRSGVILYKNGAPYSYGSRTYSTTDGVQTGTWTIFLQAGDYIEAYGIKEDTSAGGFDDAIESEFMAVRIR